MISLDGAALIATVYPVGMLILVFEMRFLLSWLGRRFLRRAWAQLSVGLFIGLVVFFAAASTTMCVIGVSTGVPLTGFPAGIVTVSGVTLYIVICSGVGGAVMLALSGND